MADMNDWITRFAQHRIKIADALANGALNASYSEATIILLAVLSGIAAIIWPGKNKDRKRFIELLVRYAPANLQTQYISTVMLVQEWSFSPDLRLRSAAQAIGKKYLPTYHALIITGDDADGTENIILQECPQLTPQEVREFSYVNLLYREVRCGLMHAYSFGPTATSHPMTDREAYISYTNVTDPGRPLEQYKQIHFHFVWTSKLVSSVANVADKLSTSLPLADPSKWWIDG